MLNDLYKQLCSYQPRVEDEVLGLHSGADHGLWICVAADDFPTLLLPANPDDTRPDIVLRAVDVEFSRDCRIKTPSSEAHEGCFTAIRLKETDPDITRLFLRMMEELFEGTSPLRTNAQIAENIQEIASLFSRMSDDVRGIVGLWGELNLISAAVDVGVAVSAWSTAKHAKYDFVTDEFVMDVKTCLSHLPKHRFSLEQLRPAGEHRAYIKSVCVVEQPAGRTVGELMDEIADRLDEPDLTARFLKTCIAKSGKDIYQSELRLKPYPEANSFKLYDATSIPVPLVRPGDPISDLRFDVDLTSVNALTQKEALKVLQFQKEA